MGRGTRHGTDRPSGGWSLGGAAVFLVLAALGSGACRNACQATCEPLAEFSRECGVQVPEADIQACLDAQADVPEEDLAFCREFGSPRAVDETLTCEDLPLLWGSGSGADGTLDSEG